jgi:hypothetical protein
MPAAQSGPLPREVEGEEPPKLPNLLKRKSSDDIGWGSTGKEARYLNKLRRLLG